MAAENWNGCVNFEKIFGNFQNVVQYAMQCDEEVVSEWLNCNEIDLGFQILNNEEMSDREVERENIGFTHSEAFQYLDVLMKWFESQ